jgi:hypothetical protein
MNMNKCMLGHLNRMMGHPFLGSVLDGVTMGMLIGNWGVQILSGMSVRAPPSKECLTWNQTSIRVIGWTVSTLTSPLGMPSPLSTSPIPISIWPG